MKWIFELPIILGRSFLVTERVSFNMKRNDLKFRLNNKEVKFNVCQSMKQPRDMRVFSFIKVVEEANIEEGSLWRH